MGQDDETTTEETEEQKTIRELHERIAAARKKREEAEERRAKKWELPNLNRELEQEIRAAEEAEELEKLEAEHGQIGEHLWKLETSIGMVVLRRPTPAKYRAFIDAKKITQNHQEKFVHDFVVYPDKAKFNAMVSATPGLINRCSDALIYLAGWREREEAAGN